jgi:tetratricopeptide (TPR) repeat protein
MILGWNYSQKGLHEQAIHEAETAVKLSDNNPMMVGRLGRILAMAGRREEAQAILDNMLEQSKPGQAGGGRVYVSPYYIAIIYLKLGRVDPAFEWFDRAYEIRDDMIIHLKADPDFDEIKSDPRYKALLQKMNLN